MNQLRTAFWLVLLTVLLVLIGRLTFGVAGMYAFLGLALVMNASAYWFSDRIALASAQALEVGPEEASMLHRLADRLAIQYRVPKPRVYVPTRRLMRLRPGAAPPTRRSVSTRVCSESSTKRSCTEFSLTSLRTCATATS